MGEPLIDLTRTAALGDPGTPQGRAALVEIFRVYFDNVGAACDEMRRATSADVVRAQAHRAKGASGIVGAVALTTIFADLEARAAAGETVPDEAFDEIERQLAGLRQAVSARTGEDFQ
ncbi:MAG: Hpt domain-containing protein [Vicinamibacterales bacterium]